ncbi:MAG: hypothetical protein ACKOF7_02270, partial [Phycisphaerales bacterium]
MVGARLEAHAHAAAAAATAAASANPASTLEVMLSGRAPANPDFAVSLAATLSPDAAGKVVR